MTNFTTGATLEVALDENSLRQAESRLAELGPATVGGNTVSSGMGMRSDGGTALAAGGGVVTNLADTANDILETNRNILEHVEGGDPVGGGGGGGLLGGTLGKVGLGSLLGSLSTGTLSRLLGSVGIGSLLGRLGGGAGLARLLGTVGVGSVLGGLVGGELGKLLGHENIGKVLGALGGGALAAKLGSVGIGSVLTGLGGGAVSLPMLLGSVAIGTLVYGELKLLDYITTSDATPLTPTQETSKPNEAQAVPGQEVDAPGYDGVTIADPSKTPDFKDMDTSPGADNNINLNVDATVNQTVENPAPERVADEALKKFGPKFKKEIRRAVRNGNLDKVLSSAQQSNFQDGF